MPSAKQCEQCGKKRYRTYGLALRVLLYESGRNKVALRIYQCPHAKGFHLTKKWLRS